MRDPRQRLLDILDAISDIEMESVKGRAAFDESRLIQVWIVHHLQIIGEAARSVPHEFREQHLSIPWRKMAGTRDFLVHDYAGIKYEVVWRIVEENLPSLKQEIQKVLTDLPDPQA